ncbi:CBS domain-containing protein [Methanogenium cariaci]|uniref:CBS domain-containing ParB/RepB/Spo0J family partition protein n=1 Tax=Methanogenium cariaci TaxID=2197 RepID=UPI0007835A05|nr:CBS domain-containing protein [Methanogenium cariaci]
MDKKKVRDYMTYDVVSIDAKGGTAKDVINAIRDTHHDGFPVIDNRKVVGYVSARDLLFVYPHTPIEKLMSRHLIVAAPDMDINDAARVIFRSGIQKLPVVDDDNNLIGIISNADVIRSQIEHVSPDKVFKFIDTLRQLHDVEPTMVRGGRVAIQNILPTQSKIYQDELEGRMYEIQKGLAEPLMVVRRPGRFVLVDGHHRAVAAHRLGIKELDAYIIEIDEDIELGLERTARDMHLSTLDDIKILDYARHPPLVALTHRLVKQG